MKKIPLETFGQPNTRTIDFGSWPRRKILSQIAGASSSKAGETTSQPPNAIARHCRTTIATRLGVAALFLLATAVCGWSEVILRNHESFGTPSGFFADFTCDEAYVYTNPRDFVYVGYFYSNAWTYNADWHTEFRLGVWFQQGASDDISSPDPGPYAPAHPHETFIVFQQNALPTYTKCNDKKVGGDQPGCAGGCSTASSAGMARYSAHAMLASLSISDTPLLYTPGRGPSVDFTLT